MEENSGKTDTKKRILWLDYARTFAIICVILCHTTERVYPLNATDIMQNDIINRLFSVAMFTMGRLGVPIFFFLTGYLLLGREYNYDKYRHFFKHNFLSILITTEIWIIIYNIFNVWFYHESINLGSLIKNMLFMKQTNMSHMWYMPVIIGIYMFIPFVSNAFNHTDIRNLYMPLLVTFVCCFVAPTINTVLRVQGREQLYPLLDISFSGGGYGFCVILGYLVKMGLFDRITSLFLVLSGVVSYIATIVIQIYSDLHEISYNVWYDCAFLIICSLSIFILMSRTKHRKIAIGHVITRTSVYAFGIYLVHKPLNMILISCLDITPRIAKVFEVSVITFIVSWFIVWLLSKVKIISKLFFNIN